MILRGLFRKFAGDCQGYCCVGRQEIVKGPCCVKSQVIITALFSQALSMGLVEWVVRLQSGHCSESCQGIVRGPCCVVAR